MIPAHDRVPPEPDIRAGHWLDSQFPPALHGFFPPLCELHQKQPIGKQLEIRTDPGRHDTPGQVWSVVHVVDIMLALISPALWPRGDAIAYATDFFHAIGTGIAEE